MKHLSEMLSAIESSENQDVLRGTLQAIAEDYGFASFGFIDIGHPELDQPFWMATSPGRWISEYDRNGFVHLDPVIPVARRTNRPFFWSSVSIPPRMGKKKPLAHVIMDAARDFGMRDGLVIPFHYVDGLGRMHSSCATFHWSEPRSVFSRLPAWRIGELHTVMIYWTQKLIDVTTRDLGRRDRSADNPTPLRPVRLTDREKLVLEWAARGKTVSETSAILSISSTTVESHVRNALDKLDAVSKTQAAVKAVKLGLIDV